MAQKTYKDIEAEAERRFGKKASREKFEFRRAQQAAAGLEQETKKRGGVAGAYDRNKKLVSAAATVAGFLTGGPAGAGLARGAVQGLDRPGEGGIGFDVRRGVKGFTEGYGAGKIANIGKAGLQRLFTSGADAASPSTAFDAASGKYVPKGTEFNPVSPGAGGFTPTTMAEMPGSAAAGAPNMAVTPPVGGSLKPLPRMVSNRMTDRFNIGPNTMRSPITSVPTSASAALPAVRGGQAPGFLGRLFGSGGTAGPLAEGGAAGGGSTLRSLLTNPQVIAGAAGGVADVMGQRSQQRIAEQQMAQQQQQFQQRFDVEEEERKRQQEQANRLAAMFMPRR